MFNEIYGGCKENNWEYIIFVTEVRISQMDKQVEDVIREAIKLNRVEKFFSQAKDLNVKNENLFEKAYLEKINKIEIPNTMNKIFNNF